MSTTIHLLDGEHGTIKQIDIDASVDRITEAHLKSYFSARVRAVEAVGVHSRSGEICHLGPLHDDKPASQRKSIVKIRT